MRYYKVNVSADQTRKNVNKIDILIANELYTENELQKFAKKDSVYVKSYFTEVEISRKNTFFLFGARFSKV